MEALLEALLIDDHQFVNMGLASCLEETGRLSAIAQITTLAEAVNFIEKTDENPSRSLPSLIILDIMLGEDNRLDFLPFLKDFAIKGKKQCPL